MPTTSPLAGKPPRSMLVDVPRLVRPTTPSSPTLRPAARRIRDVRSSRSSLDGAFNEAHIVAIDSGDLPPPREHGIDGPLFLGIDTHALSAPGVRDRARGARGNGVEVMIDASDATRRRRSSRTRSSPTTAGASPGSPTASSSRRRTIRRSTAASSTTRRTAAPPIPTSRAGSRAGQRAPRRRAARRRRECRSSALARAATTHRHDYLDALRRAICRRWSTSKRSARQGSHRRGPARRRERGVLGRHRRALRPRPRSSESRRSTRRSAS